MHGQSFLPVIHVSGDVVKKPGTGLGPRVLGDYELLFFPDGSGTVYRVEEEAHTLREPCFIMTRPGERHQYDYDPQQPTRHLFLHFGFERNATVMPDLDILKPGGPSVVPGGGELPLSMLKQILFVSHAAPDRVDSWGGALLLALLHEVNGLTEGGPPALRQSRIPPQLAKALDHIEKHLDEPLSVERLAQASGWTHEHFSRSFVKHLGRTPREAIIHKRIERACQMLLHEERSVKEVAYAVGFADENYFSRVFKSVKGMTATEYRTKHSNPIYKDLAPIGDGDSLYPPNRILYNSWTK
ncbi:AraC family transcriptional regulator [Paenibacillus arenilitoris]|uniref:Helix-turn-helix transcriptional regulator n=1 Tax=Paenibacillus arenilitoris TaxID=2772299 RepID=A0A927H575_9BACL|nr:helix-turn-helix domain-containing protein [Paenibacillus arenilitoris]MBD2869191.1 helix-turn-helix transcriptional regulator [Paenibacillus arenilitoris]